MTIQDVIREASNEHEVYFLLTAYVEAVRYGDLLSCLPSQARDLPLNGLDDVRGRIDGLRAQLDSGEVKLPDERTRILVKESADGSSGSSVAAAPWPHRTAR